MKLLKNSTIVLPNDLWAWQVNGESTVVDNDNVQYWWIPKNLTIKVLDIYQADYSSNTLKFEVVSNVYKVHFYTMIENLEECLGKEIENNF